MTRTLIFALALSVLPLSTATAVPTQVFDANASEWSSLTLPVPGVVLPILGSGQANGNFALSVDPDFPNLEIGLRANERFSPVPLPNVAGQYFAQPGTSGGPPSSSTLGATWNYDIHIDLRGSGLSFDDFDIAFTSSIAALSTTDLQASLETLSGANPGDLDNVELFQTSQNALFGGLIDPLASGDYTFDLTLTPKSGVSAPTLGTAIIVTVVPEPAAAGLVLLAIGAAACRRV